jgi:predicted CXXCH cytochrome family protein
MAGYIILLFLLMVSPVNNLKPHYPELRKEDCLTCHGNLIKNAVVHPQLESTCDICHTATGGEHPKKNVKGFTLSEKLPGLCFNCHTDFQEHLASYSSVHGAVRDSLSCLNCHNPHSSPQKKLLTDGTNDLCLNCHDKTIRKDTVRIRNIKQVLTNAKSVHAAIDGGCVTCHNPHFSEKRTLLTGSFPSGLYVKSVRENFELCFMCHDTDLLEAQSTEFGTNFRNGKKNLHFVHINGDKGRNCTVCHDVHGAANEKLISDKLRFGSWEMKINFNTAENGGSCLTACHSERKYDRTIPKPISAAKPVKAENQKKQSPVKTVYTIQLLASKTHVNMSRFKGINGVREIVSPDGYFRYVCGEYNATVNANSDLVHFHETGYKNAFIRELNSLIKK